jgi:adenine C2-methylase RlmN of 23S rRNA A2503 and tRNA A37
MIDGLTDTSECAKALVTIANQLPCKINLIAYNPIVDAKGRPLAQRRYGGEQAPEAKPTTESPYLEFRPSSQDAIIGFRNYLYPRCPAVTIRQPKGLNIAAACGQLVAIDKQP